VHCTLAKIDFSFLKQNQWIFKEAWEFPCYCIQFKQFWYFFGWLSTKESNKSKTDSRMKNLKQAFWFFGYWLTRWDNWLY
jgi:hypothetical protein